jgi:hypothetical protein
MQALSLFVIAVIGRHNAVNRCIRCLRAALSVSLCLHIAHSHSVSSCIFLFIVVLLVIRVTTAPTTPIGRVTALPAAIASPRFIFPRHITTTGHTVTVTRSLKALIPSDGCFLQRS